MSSSTGTASSVFHNGFGYISLSESSASFRGMVGNASTYFDIIVIGK